jgi:uncharacterized protein YcbX
MTERIAALWRYPIKSMMGEPIDASAVSERGLAGDRARALVDPGANRAAAVRTWGQALMRHRAAYEHEPVSGEPPPPVRVTTPGGETLTGAEIASRMSELAGRPLSLMDEAPAGLLLEFPPGTLAARAVAMTEGRLASDAPAGTFFDVAPLHLILASTIEAVAAAQPGADVGVERFRPNLVIEGAGPFAETGWIGRRAAVGEAVVRVSGHCPRCVNVTLPQADLEREPGLLKTIARANPIDLGFIGRLPCAGVYASVETPGRIARGAALRWLD